MVATLIFNAALGWGQVTVTVRYEGKNLDAQLLVLDAGSLQAPLSSSIRVDSEQKCELLCQGIQGCNAYVYCNNKEGCPGNCGQYVANYPMLSGDGQDNYQFSSLPLTGFGRYYYSGSSNGCMPSDATRWPYGLCSLKKQPEGVEPKFFGGSTSEGWTSAVLTSSQPCYGLPFALCDVCYSLNSGLSASCLQCAQDVYSATGAGKLVKATAGWYCLWCINRKQDPTSCGQCLRVNVDLGLPYLCV